MKPLLAFLGKHAWIFVVLAFLGLVVAWTGLVLLTKKFPQEEIQVPKK